MPTTICNKILNDMKIKYTFMISVDLFSKKNDLHRQTEPTALVRRAFHALPSPPPEWK